MDSAWEEHGSFAIYLAGYFCLQWTTHFLCGKAVHRGLSKGCLYASSLHQGFLLPLLTVVSIYRTLDAKVSFSNWLATPSASLMEAERHPAYAMVAYLLSDLTDFRSPAFSYGLIAHHLITMFAVYTMVAWLPAYSNLAFLGMVVVMEFGSLGLNLSQLGIKAVTNNVRYYMYTVTRVVAVSMWTFLMVQIDISFEERCGYVASGLAFWAHNFHLWLHLRKTRASKKDVAAFEVADDIKRE